MLRWCYASATEPSDDEPSGGDGSVADREVWGSRPALVHGLAGQACTGITALAIFSDSRVVCMCATGAIRP
jgi:hypothetical protein